VDGQSEFYGGTPAVGTVRPRPQRFENLAPKYLHQEILANFFQLFRIHNHVLYPQKPVLLPISVCKKQGNLRQTGPKNR